MTTSNRELKKYNNETVKKKLFFFPVRPSWQDMNGIIYHNITKKKIDPS